MEDRMSTFEIRPIGKVSSSLRTLDAAARQADEGAPEAWLVFEPEAVEGLRNIRAGDELVLITWLDRSDRRHTDRRRQTGAQPRYRAPVRMAIFPLQNNQQPEGSCEHAPRSHDCC
jgi:tRNA (Thr-GGU) A37 N-methylase